MYFFFPLLFFILFFVVRPRFYSYYNGPAPYEKRKRVDKIALLRDVLDDDEWAAFQEILARRRPSDGELPYPDDSYEQDVTPTHRYWS